ncbi:MAG: hypothetical protein KKC03_12270 [Bacteroidetes bacterium]|nr:hypothetical protein [Bacteroidota bacterium]
MKNFLKVSFKSIKTYGVLSLGLLFASACGTYEYAGVSDGVYGEPVVYNTPTNTYPSKVVERSEGGEDSGSFYKNYFAEKSNQYRINMNAVDTTANPEVFTDIDGYSSANFDGDNLNFGSESYTYSEGYGGWGDETESVVINYYNNYSPFYGYGAGYWGGFGYPYYGYGFGYPYYDYGFGYRPYYGYARPYYGYGYGYPRYGFGFAYGGFGFGFYNSYNPYYYGGGFGHSRSHVAYNSSRRGSVSRVNSSRGVVSENNGRTTTTRRGSSVTNSNGRRVTDVRNTSYYRNRVSADGNSNSRIRSQVGTRGTNGRGTVSTTSNIRSTGYYSRRVNTSTRGDVNGRLRSRGTGDIRSGNGSRGRSEYTGGRTGVLTRSSSGIRSRGSNGAVRSTGGSRSSGGAIRSSGGSRSSGGAIRSSGGGRSSGGAIRSGGGGGGRSGGAIRSSGGGRGGSN